MIRMHHVNLVVSDIDRSLDFYCRILGMRQTFDIELAGEWIETVVGIPGATARCVFVQPPGGGPRIELLQYHHPQAIQLVENSSPNTPGIRHLALEVDDIDTMVERLRSENVTLFSEPVAVPFQLVDGIRKRLVYTLDPDGVIVEFSSHEKVDH